MKKKTLISSRYISLHALHSSSLSEEEKLCSTSLHALDSSRNLDCKQRIDLAGQAKKPDIIK